MLTKEESDAIKVMIKDWPSPEPGSFGTDAAKVLLEAVDRETEVVAGPPELHALILRPLLEHGKLAHIKIEIRDAPGFFSVLTANAAAELRDGINYLLKVKNWENYSSEFGWVEGSPPPAETQEG